MFARSRAAAAIAAMAIGLAAARGAFGDWQTSKLKAVLSATETKGGGDTRTSFSWTFDGEWRKPMSGKTLTLTVDSDYSKSETAKLDRLRTTFRLIDLDKKSEQTRYSWRPVWLVQTEGDHGLDTMHTLVAAGYRQKRKYGSLELTLGASRDIKTHDPWIGDFGFEVTYSKQLADKWTLGVNPKGDLGIIGNVRQRGDRLRYSWDISLDYQATKKLGVGYHLWYGNTLPNSDRTQWLGITYRMK